MPSAPRPRINCFAPLPFWGRVRFIKQRFEMDKFEEKEIKEDADASILRFKVWKERCIFENLRKKRKETERVEFFVFFNLFFCFGLIVGRSKRKEW